MTTHNQTPTYTVIYQTGGLANFRWNRTAINGTRQEAIAKAIELERAGYPAIVQPTRSVESIGLPDGAAERTDDYEPVFKEVGNFLR